MAAMSKWQNINSFAFCCNRSDEILLLLLQTVENTAKVTHIYLSYSLGKTEFLSPRHIQDMILLPFVTNKWNCPQTAAAWVQVVFFSLEIKHPPCGLPANPASSSWGRTTLTPQRCLRLWTESYVVVMPGLWVMAFYRVAFKAVQEHSYRKRVPWN